MLKPLTVCLLGLGMVFLSSQACRAASAAAPAPNSKPTLYLIGDSTVKNGTPGLKGWGEVIAPYFDLHEISIVNDAIGGRSSRTFLTEGRWDKVMAKLKPGDFVLMQFGHNDGANPKDPRGKGRGSIRGTGDETVEAPSAAGKMETVHSYGWYMRQYVEGAKSKGATPIVLSPIPRNDWKDGKVLRNDHSYGKWARETAEAGHVDFINLNEICARHYEQLGQAKVKAMFPREHTHTNAAGADLNAQCVIAGIKGLKNCPLARHLSAKAAPIAPADAVESSRPASTAPAAP